jgi:hypothetical protein
MCPFRKSNCGDSSSFAFDAVNQAQDINITLPLGETCTFQLQASCGLPSFKPNDTTGFDIETIDYDEDDLAEASSGRRMLDGNENKNEGKKEGDGSGEKRKFNSNSTQPKPPKNFQIKKEEDVEKEKKNKTEESKNGSSDSNKTRKATGPQKKTYDPSEGKERKFKGGEKPENATICKKRYQQIIVTALGDVNTTAPARILQTGVPVYTMTL